MNVCVYNGLENTVKKSGVGKALEHQRNILKCLNVNVSDRLTKDTDVIHINTIFPDSVLTAKRAHHMGKKVIYYGHSTEDDFRNSFKGSNLFAPLFRKWIRFCYRHGDIVITPTDYSKGILDTYELGRPVYALSNGIDTDFFRPNKDARARFLKKYGLSDKSRLVMSVGHFMERKGLVEYVALAKRMPEIEFFWFGYTNLRMVTDKVRYAIEHAPANLHFAGYADREALCEAYQSCDIFCFMSYEETEGIVVLESLACEIPVIIRDIPVYSDWLKNGRQVYKAKCNDDFSNLIRQILENGKGMLTENGRKTAEERSYKAISEKLEKIYTALYEHTANSKLAV